MSWKLGVCGAIAIGVGVFLCAEAQAASIGEYEYKNSCSQCHGTSGKGDGPYRTYLTKAPSDLTVLQKNNGGVFPVGYVYSIVEGSADVSLHGPRDMPLWGSRFRVRAMGDDDKGGMSREESKEYARMRILSLIEYLSTMQVK